MAVASGAPWLAQFLRASCVSPAAVFWLRTAIKAESGLGPITKGELDAETAMTPEAAAAFMAREPTEVLAAQDTDNDEVDNEAYDEAEAGMD